MSVTRRLMFDYRMEADPNAYAIMNLFVDRVRRAPKCFGMQFMAAIWTQDRTHNIVLQVRQRRAVERAAACRGLPRARLLIATRETASRALQVNYLGLQLYNLGESQTLLASFQYLGASAALDPSTCGPLPRLPLRCPR